MQPTITSLQNQRVKDAAKLRDARARRKQGRIVVDGAREISRALTADLMWSEAFVCEELLRDGDDALLAGLAQGGAEILPVTRGVFAKLAFGDRAEGIVAAAHAPSRTLVALKLPPAPLVAVLEGIEKPGNVGAILRTADAAGVSAVILSDAAAELFNPNTI
ncbi:MAG: hypothetical protein KDA41_07460, partial [Planctomycetales bacterium]|nr:hypothetical protein [Planctomycetales bacterium]